MQFQFKKKIGQNEFTFVENAGSNAEFFEKVSFYSALPSVGPNGEDDLEIVFREPKGYQYYSIVSKKAGMELKFGQLKEPKGALFMKDWEPLYQGDENGQTQTSGGLGSNAPTATTSQSSGGLGATAPAPTPAPAAAAPAPAPAQQAAPAQAATQQVNQAQVNTQANDVLSKFLNA